MKHGGVIIYVGNFFYPDGNAAGKRVWGNLEAIRAAGFKTACLCFRKENGSGELEVSNNLETDLYTIPYTSGFDRLKNSVPKQVFKTVLDKYHDQKIVAVIMYNSLGTTEFNSFVVKECHKRAIKAYYDIADYFDVPHKANVLRYYMKKRELNQLTGKVLPACDGWIAISSFLRNMMPNPEKTIVVPPLSVSKANYTPRPQTELVISYATFIVDKNRPISEWKDRIDSYIDVFIKLNDYAINRPYEIHFLGFYKEDLLEMFPDDIRQEYAKKIEILGDKVKFFGPMSNKEVQQHISNSDYTILLRDSKTSNNAGFPTKISESISLGVPPITNITSDIGCYIKDGVNGIVVSDPQDIQSICDKIAAMFNEDLQESLRQGAVNTEGFYYISYAEKFKAFFSGENGQ